MPMMPSRLPWIRRPSIQVGDQPAAQIGERVQPAVGARHRSEPRRAFEPEHPTPWIERWRDARFGALVAAVGLVVCAPLFAAIALLIKWDSAGPVFFIQERIGQDGKQFSLVKFRTMRPVDQRPSEWVRDNGDRITAVGGWLRQPNDVSAAPTCEPSQ